MELNDQQWRERLTPEEYRVLREGGTEAPFMGEYTDTDTVGVYHCRGCGAELFRSEHKFHSGCGWPSFYQPAEKEAVETQTDRGFFITQQAIRRQLAAMPNAILVLATSNLTSLAQAAAAPTEPVEAAAPPSKGETGGESAAAGKSAETKSAEDKAVSPHAMQIAKERLFVTGKSEDS